MTSTEKVRELTNKAERELATLRIRLAQDGITIRTDEIIANVVNVVRELKVEYNSQVPKERKVK